MISALLGTKCGSCGKRTRDPVPAPVEASLPSQTMVCKPCSLRLKAEAAARAEAEAERQAREKADAEKNLKGELEAERRQREHWELDRAKGRRAKTEAERLEAEAMAKGELLPRQSEPDLPAQSEGIFGALGLIWQREPAPQAMNLVDAKNYAAGLTLAGARWRLPTVSELKALYESELSFYPGMKRGWYWSDTPYPEGNTWCVDFGNGASAGNIYGKPIGVRCVARSAIAAGQHIPPDRRHRREAPHTARRAPRSRKSNRTARLPTEASEAAKRTAEQTFRAAGLIWQREPAPWKMDWEDAKSYAARLTVAGGGWRLPTLPELRSLYLEKSARDLWNEKWSPPIAAYPGMDKGWYWSSELTSSWDFIGGVDFADGKAAGYHNTSLESVRCVKS